MYLEDTARKESSGQYGFYNEKTGMDWHDSAFAIDYSQERACTYMVIRW